jgi:hypothetical protein
MAATEDLGGMLRDQAGGVVLVAGDQVAVVIDRPEQPAGWVVRPVIHRLEPLPTGRQLKRLDGVQSRVELLECLALERPPASLDEARVPVRPRVPHRLHRLDVVGGQVRLVVPEHEVNPRHPRVTGRLVDQPPVLPGDQPRRVRDREQLPRPPPIRQPAKQRVEHPLPGIPRVKLLDLIDQHPSKTEIEDLRDLPFLQ